MLPFLLALLIFGSLASAQDVGRAALDAANRYLLLVNQGASTVPRCPFTEEFIYLYNSCTFLPDLASLSANVNQPSGNGLVLGLDMIYT